MQLADRLTRQKELNPRAQQQQIILGTKSAFPILEQCSHLQHSDPKCTALGGVGLSNMDWASKALEVIFKAFTFTYEGWDFFCLAGWKISYMLSLKM